jgi:hypothetical protein
MAQSFGGASIYKINAALETDTKPGPLFSEKKITSLAVQSFDAKGVQTYRSVPVDYVDLARNFTDDLIRAFYENGKLRVSLGEVLDQVTVNDLMEKRVGDVNVKRSEITTSVTYKASPYRKVDAQISGRITKYSPEDQLDKSYIEVYFKVTDAYDGTIYWITKMRGTYSTVLKTMMETISTGVYSPSSGDEAVDAGKSTTTNAQAKPAGK